MLCVCLVALLWTIDSDQTQTQKAPQRTTTRQHTTQQPKHSHKTSKHKHNLHQQLHAALSVVHLCAMCRERLHSTPATATLAFCWAAGPALPAVAPCGTVRSTHIHTQQRIAIPAVDCNCNCRCHVACYCGFCLLPMCVCYDVGP